MAAPMLSPYDELKSAVDILHEEGNVERSARDMFGGVLDLQVLHVSDVMIHRTKMRTIDADLPPAADRARSAGLALYAHAAVARAAG